MGFDDMASANVFTGSDCFTASTVVSSASWSKLASRDLIPDMIVLVNGSVILSSGLWACSASRAPSSASLTTSLKLCLSHRKLMGLLATVDGG